MWCLNQVMPRVRAVRPDVTLWVTGDTGDLPLDRMPNRDSVRFTGRLPDVKDAVGGATATVVPLLVGGGTRLKVLESLALGTPVVSTAKGVEGLDVVNGTHALVERHRRPIQRRRAPAARRPGPGRAAVERGPGAGAFDVHLGGDWPAAARRRRRRQGRDPAVTDDTFSRAGDPARARRCARLSGAGQRPVSRRVRRGAGGPRLHRPDVRRPRPRAVLVVGHVVASGAVHSEHDDPRAECRHLPQPGDVDAGAGPGALRAVVRRPVPVVAHRGRRRRRSGPRGDDAAAGAQRRSGAGGVLAGAGRRRLRMDLRGRQVRARPGRRAVPRSHLLRRAEHLVRPLRLSVSAAGAGLHADRAGRRIPRAHGARPRRVGGVRRRRARRRPAARLRPGGRLRGRRHVLDRRAGAGPGDPVAAVVGDRRDPRLLGAARRLLPVPDLVGCAVAVGARTVRQRRGVDAGAAAARGAARRAARARRRSA